MLGGCVNARARVICAALTLGASIAGCGELWNDPYPASERGRNILYSAFIERPKHLDPAKSYARDESVFTRQVYEPPLQYHYFKRPYELIPLTAAEMPRVRIVERGGEVYSVYEIRIRKGILYQPHPAFHAGNRRLAPKTIRRLRNPYALPGHGTRQLVADDYIYQIKRLAEPRVHSPIFKLMSGYVVGLREYARRLKEVADALARDGKKDGWIDLRKYPLEGVERVDAHTFRVTLKGRYPQFAYWLAMPFFAPMPWEADEFFHQPGMAAQNFTLDWWPIGTGPFMLTTNDPNARMVLERNPNYRGEPYPAEGEPEDEVRGLLADAGRRMPFIDQAVYTREREAIPYWNKFLEGYYDSAGISSDQFDQAVRIPVEGPAEPSREMRAHGIRLSTSVAATIYYFGFNMRDPVVGGRSERARKLRQAISIAVDMEEYLSIFENGRGVVAQSPLPPGIFGRREGREGINPVTHVWTSGLAQRRPIEDAKKLLAEAGYPNGRDARTGQPLVLYFDTTARGPGDRARLDWWRKQFAKLSIQLQVRDTDWNRFQEKIRKGTQQFYGLGWAADYPDPENFLFLLHGPQARAAGLGANSSNYENPAFDALFEKMKTMSNTSDRQALIDRMVRIVQNDAPWVFGFHPQEYVLSHAWIRNNKPNTMAGNTLKYLRVNAALRAEKRREWNQPVFWPIGLVVVLVIAAVAAASVSYRRRERMAGRSS